MNATNRESLALAEAELRNRRRRERKPDPALSKVQRILEGA